MARWKLPEPRTNVVSRNARALMSMTVDLPVASLYGSRTVELMPLASNRVIVSVSERAADCPIACSKNRCDVFRVRFSHRRVPLRLANGADCPALGGVE